MAQVLRNDEDASQLLALDALDASLRRLTDDVLRVRRRCAEVRAACQQLATAVTESGWDATGGAASLARLTRRERLVAALVAGGKSNPEVAAELHVSVYTIKSQMRSVLRKLEISSRWQLSHSLPPRLETLSLPPLVGGRSA